MEVAGPSEGSRQSGRPTRRGVAAISLATLALLIAAAAALAVTGEITQLPGTAGCVSETGSDPFDPSTICADAKALSDANAVTVSPDGKSVYVASDDAVAVFQRDTTTGELSQLAGLAGCVSQTGSDGACTHGKALVGATDVTVSPDGKDVYVASIWSNAVAVFQRDQTTGELTQLPGLAGCIRETGGACSDGRALWRPRGVAVSSDGKNVYVGSRLSDAVAVLTRNTTTGELSQPADTAGCVSETGSDPSDPSTICADGKALDHAVSVALSVDGKNVYVASSASGHQTCYITRCAVSVFSRDTTTGELNQLVGTAGCISQAQSGPCTGGKALGDPRQLAVSGDGKTVYVASSGTKGIAIFRRNATSGALTQLVGPLGRGGCVSQRGSNGACTDGRALDGATSVAVSADGKSVYLASAGSDAVAVFSRGPTVGALKQLEGTAGCVSQTGSDPDDPATVCADGRALDGAFSVAVSPDGKSVYVASADSDAVTVFSREVP